MRISLDAFVECLQLLADEKLQREVFVKGSGTELLPDYTELICSAFDSSGVSDTIQAGELELEFGYRSRNIIMALYQLVRAVPDDEPLEKSFFDPVTVKMRSFCHA